MSFKRAIKVITVWMAICGFPLFEEKKVAKVLFKLIQILQIYCIFGRFYETYVGRCEVPADRVNVGVHVALVVSSLMNAVNMYVGLVVLYHRRDIILLIDKLEDLFSDLKGKSTSLFLKIVSLQRKIWFLILFLFLLIDYAAAVEATVYTRSISLRFLNKKLGNLNGTLIFTVSMLTILVMSSTAFLFDLLTTFEVKGDLRRLARLIKMHRKCCEIARSSNKIFNSIIASLLIFTIVALIGLLAFIFVNDWRSNAHDWRFVIMTTSVCLALLVYIALRPANVNNKLNASIDYILSVGSSFDSPTLSTRKSFALMAKVDLYVTHVALSECYMSNGGITRIENTHVITILGFILSYVVVIISKTSRERNINYY